MTIRPYHAAIFGAAIGGATAKNNRWQTIGTRSLAGAVIGYLFFIVFLWIMVNYLEKRIVNVNQV